ncbi:MAG: 50S ribosomal protein L10 [Tenericutes bacterium]|nr:50S ribosomal protein L10 [Mycoplasmatota bacterium]
MASEKNLKLKKDLVSEINSKLDKANTVLLVDYQGMTVGELNGLRKSLKDSGSDLKVYKNTLASLAFKDKGIKLDDYMTGPNAYIFSSDIIEPIKLVSEVAKKNDNLTIKAGYINGEFADEKTINEYASIPSYEGLLTMFAGGLIEHVRNLSIALNLYAEKMENGGNE